jgi:hypothetical protein
MFNNNNNLLYFGNGSTLGKAPFTVYYVWEVYEDAFFSGDIAEIMVFNGQLTPAQRRGVNNYLNAKYALVPAVPAAPTNLLAHAISPTQVSLTWDDALNGAVTQFGIERSTASNGVYQVLAQIPAGTSYLDASNLVPGTTYYYRVRAVNIDQWSSYSPIASATTPILGTNLPLNSLALWLKADAGLLQGTSSVPVNTWLDQSGNNLLGIGSPAPLWVPNAIGDRPVVHFNYASLTLPNFMAGATSGEAFLVLKSATNSTNPNPLWEMGGDGWNSKTYDAPAGTISDDFGSFGGYGNSGVHSFTTAQPLDQYHVYEVSSQTNDWDAWINGVWQAHSGKNTVSFGNAPSLGLAPYWVYYTDFLPVSANFAGDVAEVLVFNRSLTADERATVNAYLNGKYALVPALPATPSNLVATAISPTQILLTWDAILNNGATRFSVERLNPVNLTYQELAEVPGATSYLDTNAPPGAASYYRVRAINTDQWSPYSNPAGTTTPVAGPAVPFADLAAWLRADAGAGLSTNATPVAVWPDESGNQNFANQPSFAAQPVWIPGANGQRPTLFFNGTNSSTTLPSFLSGAAEAFVVLKTSVTNELHSLWDFGGPDEYNYKAYPDVDGSISDGFGSDSIYPMGVPPPPLNQWHVYDAASAWDNWEAWINGTLLYQSSETSFNTVDFSGGMELGGSAYLVEDDFAELGYDVIPLYFAGNISELLVFDRTLTDDERAAVNTYLTRKYVLAPVVAITSPANNAVIAGVTNLTLSATATDTAGIAQVEFLAGLTPLGSVTSPPYSLLWSNAPLGSYSLTALATDNRGLSFTSAVVNVTVAGVAITAPANNALFPASAPVPISVAAVDVAGISQLQLFQGANILATLTNEPYYFAWSNAPAGAYALTAVATDGNGLTMTSSVVNVTVDNFPSVTLTSPTNNARFIAGANINLAATAADGSDAIASVQFFQGTNLLGGVTSAPYSFTWTNAPAGAYALTAQATDLGGLVTTSAVVNIMVAGITLTNPPNNDVFAAPASATLGVAVTDNASITQVQFFQGTNSLGIVTSPPYTVNWTGATPGVYTLTATGQDATGFVFTSAPVTVIVDTNPTTTNRSGDGQSDYLDYLEGRNPLVGTVPDTQNLINFQVYTPLQ